MGCLWLFTANAEGISGTNWLMSVGAPCMTQQALPYPGAMLCFTSGLVCGWACAGGLDLRHAPTQDQYIAAVRCHLACTLVWCLLAIALTASCALVQIHFAMTTMSTVGYGDVSPRTRTERLVAMVIMAVGVCMVPCAPQAASAHVATKVMHAWPFWPRTCS